MVSQTPAHHLENFLALLAHQPGVLVQVDGAQGSVPREACAWMAVFADALVGTVGGGHLEHDAIATAHELLKSGPGMPKTQRFALGPALGQCCGGVVQLRFELVSQQDLTRLAQRLKPLLSPVALFGGGHVGHALVRVLSSLPFALTWVDSREGVFPDEFTGFSAGPSEEKMCPSGRQGATQIERVWGPYVSCEHSEPVEGAVRTLTPQSAVLIMSFSHAEDLEVLAACLKRQRQQADLPYIGLIGSQTKWATFRNRLQARGFTPDELAHVTSPIGVPGIHGKQPEVIAVAVAAQILQIVASQ